MKAIVTVDKPAKCQTQVSNLFNNHANVYGVNFLYNVKEVEKELNEGLPKAEKELDNTMKGWKSSGETQFGIIGDVSSFYFWYQRLYTK